MRCRIRRRRVTRRDVTPVTRDHRHERGEHAGGPPPPAAGHLGEGLGGRQRRLMSAGRGERVPDVEDPHDLRCERNLIALEPIGVAASVVPLVMPADDGLQVPRELHVRQQLDAPDRVHLDQLTLLDVGKVRVPHEILRKPGPFTCEERELVEMHPIWGIELLANVEFPWDLKPIIRWHHERYDGSGYPDRLKGDEIPLAAQIVGILDVWDALTTARAHQPALPPAQALAEMTRCRGWWSPRVFAAFVTVIARDGRHVAPGHTTSPDSATHPAGDEGQARPPVRHARS